MSGCFALSGSGPVPKDIWNSLDCYNALYEVMEKLPIVTRPILKYNGEGNYADWLAYASKGIFAYDYHDVHRTHELGHYDVIAIPERPIKASDLGLSQNLSGYLPILEVDFSVAGNIENSIIAVE